MKGKNLLRSGANSFLSGAFVFPFTVAPFQKGDKNTFDIFASPESVSILLPFHPVVSEVASSSFEFGHVHCCKWGFQ